MNKRYKLSVPVMNLGFSQHMSREKTVEILKEMKADRVFLALESRCLFPEEREAEMKALKENSGFLHRHGFEVGAWLWSMYKNKNDGFAPMEGFDGKKSNETICPTDDNFCETMGSFLAECACTGIDMIMFDDDYRCGFHDIGFGCFCEKHIERINSILGENADRDTIVHNVMNAGRNRYRDAFIKANGQIFEEYAQKCRNAVNSANPNVRLGFCSCITSWDIDGTTPDRISKILAGSTKPFYRLIGAPYWAALGAWGHTRLSYVIEQERLEASRRLDTGIEIFSEGDTYPRPRYRVPSSYLEGLDTVLRADGCTDGILKYSFDYTADCTYETGYNERHIRNLPVYEAIDGYFSDKETVGVRVFDKAEKFADINMPTDKEDPCSVQLLAFNVGARFLASNSIPTAYSGNEYGGIAFGEDAKALTGSDFSCGLILDISAAEILREKGIDTGITASGDKVAMSREFFDNGERINHFTAIGITETELNEKAHIGSYTEVGGKKIPVFYTYENADGQRFAVFTFDGYSSDEGVFRNYERQKQVISSLEWLCSKKLPVTCRENPDLYLLAKKKGNTVSVGFWNFFPDKIYDAEAVFEHEIKSAKAYGIEVSFDRNILKIPQIEAYGFTPVEVTFK